MFGFGLSQDETIRVYCQTINHALQNDLEQELRSCFTIHISTHPHGNSLISFCKTQSDFRSFTVLIEDKLIAELANYHLHVLKVYSEHMRDVAEQQMKLLKHVCSSGLIHNLKPIYIPLIIQIFKETLQLIKQTRLRHPVFDVKMNSDYSQYVRGLLSNMKNCNTIGFGQNLILSACNCFIKSCFQQLNYKACQDIHESFKEELAKQLELSPKEEICTYYYYRGRISLYSEDYSSAVTYFTKALDYCDDQHERNLSRIFFFLIPLKMREECFPPQSLLDRFHFDFYSQMKSCMQIGDVSTMNAVIASNREMIIKRGLFLVVNQLQSIVSGHLLIRTLRALNTTRVSFSALQYAFRFYGVELNDEELVWLINSLLHAQCIKCQIYVTLKMVVFPNYYLQGFIVCFKYTIAFLEPYPFSGS